MKKVCVMGLGYIGLPTAIISAESGFETVGFDIDKSRVERIKNFDPVIKETEIFQRLESAIKYFGLKISDNLEQADCFVIAVPTPFNEDKTPDLSYVFNACKILSGYLKVGDVVILESTVPVGTTLKCAQLIEQYSNLISGKDFYMAYCPERVLPGKIFFELTSNSRTIGGIDKASLYKAKEFYERFVAAKFYLTNTQTAEMVKLIENSSRDVQIAFAHQVAQMSKEVGLNPYEVIELANQHPRVKILNPSCGVGGHCIAVDPWFLINTFPDTSHLLKCARNINDSRSHQVIEDIKNFINKFILENNRNPNILSLGLTFKPDTDDLRESPALYIAQEISKLPYCNLKVADPNVVQENLTDLSFIELKLTNCAQIISQYDLVICLVAHKEFKLLQNNISKALNILDFCGLTYQQKESSFGSSIQECFFWPTDSKEKYL